MIVFSNNRVEQNSMFAFSATTVYIRVILFINTNQYLIDNRR